MGASTTAMNSSMTMSAAAATSSSAASDMGGMGMGGNSCKISMTWNWYTVGACFISQSWQVTSAGFFAGSCIGVICLVVALEFLRRVQREYDALIRRVDQKKGAITAPLERTDGSHTPSSHSEDRSNNEVNKTAQVHTGAQLTSTTRPVAPPRTVLMQRQFVRAFLHMLQFGVAYFIMLLAMYYNGYIIFCIIIGAFLGSFIFSWDQILDTTPARKSEAADVTGCCG